MDGKGGGIFTDYTVAVDGPDHQSINAGIQIGIINRPDIPVFRPGSIQPLQGIGIFVQSLIDKAEG